MRKLTEGEEILKDIRQRILDIEKELKRVRGVYIKDHGKRKGNAMFSLDTATKGTNLYKLNETLKRMKHLETQKKIKDFPLKDFKLTPHYKRASGEIKVYGWKTYKNMYPHHVSLGMLWLKVHKLRRKVEKTKKK